MGDYVQRKLVSFFLVFLFLSGCFLVFGVEGQIESYMKVIEKDGFELKIPVLSVSDAVVSYEDKVVKDEFQFNITLGKLPKTNRFDVPLVVGKGLRFYYQPALSDELDVGLYDFVNETHSIRDGFVVDYRPEDVVGSYAVYVDGFHNGWTGKVCHIYRPKVFDAEGDWVWGDLSYGDGVLNVVVDSLWLLKAVYPVVVDPTFGYLDEGASYSIMDNMRGTECDLVDDGVTVVSLHGWFWSYSGTNDVKIGLYDDGKDFLFGTDVIETTSGGWYYANVSESLDSGTFYFGCIAENTNVYCLYDSTGGEEWCYTGYSWATFPSSWGGYSTGRHYCLYAYYVSGGASHIDVELGGTFVVGEGDLFLKQFFRGSGASLVFGSGLESSFGASWVVVECLDAVVVTGSLSTIFGINWLVVEVLDTAVVACELFTSLVGEGWINVALGAMVLVVMGFVFMLFVILYKRRNG